MIAKVLIYFYCCISYSRILCTMSWYICDFSIRGCLQGFDF